MRSLLSRAFPCAFPSALVLSTVVACSGSNATVEPDLGSASPSPTEDQSPTVPSPSDPGTPTTPEPAASDAGSDGGADVDAGPLVVTDLEEPKCHDLAQRGPLVTPKPTEASAPANPPPLTTAPSGLYVVTEIVEHNVFPGAPPPDPPSRTTVFVTPKRWYYLNETANERDAVTTEWSLLQGFLLRKVLCRSDGVGQSFDQRAWPSPNGFTVQGWSRAGRPLTVRYERKQ